MKSGSEPPAADGPAAHDAFGPDTERLPALLRAADRAGVGIVVLMVAPALRARFVSARCAQILGRSVSELLARPPLDLFPPAEVDEIHRILANHRKGDAPPPSFQSRVRRPDGREVVLQFGIGATEVDGEPGSVVFIHDATEAAEARLTLERSEARWRMLCESAPDAIVITRGRRIVYANRAAAALLDCARPEDLHGCSFAEILDEEDFRLMGSRIGMLRPGGPALGAQEYRARSRQGREILVEVTSVMFEDADGPAVIGFARDVTEKRRLEAQLLRADRMAALGTIAAGVAHEINNPLGFMRLALDALERETGAARAGGAAGLLADLRHGLERIGAMTRQLQTLSRADDGASADAGTAALPEVLHAVGRMVEPELRGRGAQLRIAAGALPPVRGDAGKLEQVFLNLLINAAQALAPSRVDGRVEVEARLAGEHVVTLVRDNGVGISADNLRRVFDPFFTTKPIGSGTGLGLSICHTLIAQMGGEIGLESDPAIGTTVRVSLRVADGVAATRPVVLQTAPEPRLRLLIVDDEEAILRLLHRGLAARHDVTAVSSSEEAARLVRARAFDFALLDLMMPVIGGIDLAELIARHRPALLARVAFMTGTATSDHIEVAGRRVPVLSKPFSMADLEALLERRAPSHLPS